jgi:hypothetical protein
MVRDISVIKNMLESQKIPHTYQKDRWQIPVIQKIYVPQDKLRLIFQFDWRGNLTDISVYGNVRGEAEESDFKYTVETDRELGTHARFIEMLKNLGANDWKSNYCEDPLCCSNGDTITIKRGWHGCQAELEFVFGELSVIKLSEQQQ